MNEKTRYEVKLEIAKIRADLLYKTHVLDVLGATLLAAAFMVFVYAITR